MPYEEPRLRTKRQEGGFYGRRFGYRELTEDETALHETVGVYRVKVPLGNRRTDSEGNMIDDYCSQDGDVGIKWTEWTWKKVKKQEASS